MRPEAQARGRQDEALIAERVHKLAIVGIVDAENAITAPSRHQLVVGREADAEDVGRLARVVTRKVGCDSIARPGRLE